VWLRLRLETERLAMAIDKERENHVYIAKLAEQAERYDGLSLSISQTFFFFFLCLVSEKIDGVKKAKYDV